ncbi:MAG TPA: choice-of-anchor Q domain-containing protein [Solirubrobacteraceae bacterium]|nr:choice-of-anchor Q domain-containing protein [Solirubrobacteraceae bacterium]
MKRLLVCAVTALLVLPAAASADVTVTTNLDGDDTVCNPANCTLREALTRTSAGEVVIVPARQYVLTSSITNNSAHTVRGAGARTTTISMAVGVQDRVFFLDDAPITISGVTISGGSTTGPGGGIFLNSTAALNLSDSAVAGNSADRGGGIYSLGPLDIKRSLIASNDALGTSDDAFGGGIEVANGSATLENTTISGNEALSDTGVTGRGGGIYASANLDLHNVTIAGNEAGTGAFGDGGGLFQNFAGDPRRTVATNTLVARNIGGNCAGTVNDPIESTNGVSDELSQPSCNTTGLNNQLVADTRLGSLTNNGGQTDTMALLAGSPGIDKGAPASCPATDQRGTARPSGAACDVGAYELVQAPPPPPEELPDPVPHKNVNALPKSGTVKIKLPGSDEFVELQEGQQIPLGTIVDTRKGRVTIVAAAGSGQTADFYDGLFKLSQTKGNKPITVLTLIEKLSCAKKKSQANTAAKKKKKRRLWGDGKGRFRTKGKHSAATVVGTKWLVEDRCTSTLTRVKRGKVRVRDFVKKKTVLVKAGKKYVARARG